LDENSHPLIQLRQSGNIPFMSGRLRKRQVKIIAKIPYGKKLSFVRENIEKYRPIATTSGFELFFGLTP
jgi:hypothetical protein